MVGSSEYYAKLNARKFQVQYDFIHVWGINITLKSTNKQTRKKNELKFKDRQQYGGCQSEGGGS